jgi:hypothetical protein
LLDENEHEKVLTIAVVSELEKEGKSDLKSPHRGMKNEGWGNNLLFLTGHSGEVEYLRTHPPEFRPPA